LGVGSGILASLAAVGFSPEVLMQFASLAGIGSILGKYLKLFSGFQDII
jgi:H+-translocating NAD(P) transhydrogenase